MQDIHDSENWKVPDYIRPLWIDLKQTLMKEMRSREFFEFCKRLEKFGLQPSREDIMNEIRILLGGNISSVQDRLANLSELNANVCKDSSKIVNDEIEGCSKRLQHLKNEIKTLFKTDTEYETSLGVITAMVNRENTKLKAYFGRWFENIQNRNQQQKNVFKAMAKKAQTEVRLDFHRKLVEHDLQPTPDDCNDELRNGLGNWDEINTKWENFKKTSSENPSRFFTTELEALLPGLERNAEEARQKFKKLCGVEYDLRMVRIYEEVKKRNHRLKNKKRRIFERLKIEAARTLSDSQFHQVIPFSFQV